MAGKYRKELQSIRGQSALGKEFYRKHAVGQNIDRVMMARVVKVNYKYNTVDVVTVKHNEPFIHNAIHEGKYSARLPISFGGKSANGNVYGSNTLITEGTLVLIAFVDGSKDKPIVLNMYHDNDQSSLLTRTGYTGANDDDEALQEELWTLFNLYPSMTYDSIDGRGTREVTFSGRSFMLISGRDPDLAYTSDYGSKYIDLQNARYANGETIEPEDPNAPAVLYVHQGVYSDHKTTIFIKPDGTMRVGSRHVGKEGITFQEMSPEGEYKVVHMRDEENADMFDENFRDYSMFKLDDDGDFYVRVSDQEFKVDAEGVYINGKLIDPDNLGGGEGSGGGATLPEQMPDRWNQELTSTVNGLLNNLSTDFQKSIEEMRSEFVADLAKKIGAEYVDDQLQMQADEFAKDLVDVQQSFDDAASTVTELQNRVVETENLLAQEGGRISRIVQDVDEMGLEVSTAIQDIKRTQEGVESNTSEIRQAKDEIALRVSYLEYSNYQGQVGAEINELATSINLNKEEISLKASNDYVNNVEGRVENAEAEINVQHDQIQLRVTDNQYQEDRASDQVRLQNMETKIDQNTEGITLSATKEEVNLKADQSALDGVADDVDSTITRVTKNEGQISVLNDEILLFVKESTYNQDQETLNTQMTELETAINLTNEDINLKASQQEVDTIQGNVSDVVTRVDSAEASININADQITQKVEKDTYETDKNASDARMSSAESLITQNANQINLRVTEDYLNGQLQTVEENYESFAQEQVNNLQVGGRNLILKSGNFTEDFNAYGGSVEVVEINGEKALRKSGGTLGGNSVRVETGKTYILSAKLMSTVDFNVNYIDNNGPLHHQLREIGNSSNSGARDTYETLRVEHEGSGETIPANTPFRIIVKTKVKDNLSEGAVLQPYIYDSSDTSLTNNPYYLINWKLEKGNKVTDWTPAPEDQKQYTDDKISTVVTRVASAESEIDQKADSITLSTMRTDLEATINETQEYNEQYTREQLDAMEIGTRNYIRNSGYWKTEDNGGMGLEHWNFGAWTGSIDGNKLKAVAPIGSSDHMYVWLVDSLEAGQKYTLTYYAQTDNPELEFCLTSKTTSNGFNSRDTGSVSAPSTSGAWKEYKLTFTAREDDDAIATSSTYFNDGATVLIEWMKLEKGTKSTDWTPASEDVEQTIATVHGRVIQNEASLQVASDAITARVTKDVYDAGITDTKEYASNRAKEEADNVQVGSRNLLTNSKTFLFSANNSSHYGRENHFDEEPPYGRYWLYDSSDRQDMGLYSSWIENHIDAEVGQKYTYSMEVKPNTDCRGELFEKGQDLVGGEWNHMSETITYENPETYRLRFSIYDNTDFKDVEIRRIQLEKGTKATDYKPSVEEQEQDAQAKANQAESNANDYTNTEADKLVEKYDSEISQLADRITLRVTSEEFNQTVQDTKDYASSQASSAESNAKSHADSKASEAEQNARNFTESQIELLNDKITLRVTSEEFNQTVQDTKDYADEQVRNVNVGSRNLLVGSKSLYLSSTDDNEVRNLEKVEGGESVITPLQYGEQFNSYQWIDEFLTDADNYFNDVGQAYTISADVWTNTESTTEFRFDIRSPDPRIRSDYGYISNTNGAWKRVSATIVIPDEEIRSKSLMVIDCKEGLQEGEEMRLKNWKFEKGNKATDYTPAPEDVEGYADSTAQKKADSAEQQARSFTESQIELLDDKITLRVTSDEFDNGIATTRNYAESQASSAESNAKSHADNKADSAEQQARSFTESQIELLNDKITLRVTSDEFNNSISETRNYADSRAKEEADNVQVGGTNLLRNGDFQYGDKHWDKLTEIKEDDRFRYVEATTWGVKKQIPLEKGTYTLSMYARVPNFEGTNNTTQVRVSLHNTEKHNYTEEINSEWKRVSVTVEVPSDLDNEEIYFLDRNKADPVAFAQIKLEKGNKATDWTPAPEDVEAYSDEASRRNDILKVRYIRDWLEGNTENDSNHWVEIQSMRGNENVALDASVSSTSSEDTGDLPLLTDGDTNSRPYYSGGNSEAYAVTIDLGQVYDDIDYVHVWHYYSDNRTYHGTKTEVSEDGENWIPIFDSKKSGEYVETSRGRMHIVNSGTTTASNQQYAENKASEAEDNSKSFTESQIEIVNNAISLRVTSNEFNDTVGNINNDLSRREQKLPISGISSSHGDYIILLTLSDTNGTDNYANGTIYGKRASSGNPTSGRIDVSVNTNSSGNNLVGFMEFRETQDISSDSWDLITCTYNGKNYAGVRKRGNRYRVWDQYAYFVGEIASEGEMLQAIPESDATNVQILEPAYPSSTPETRAIAHTDTQFNVLDGRIESKVSETDFNGDTISSMIVQDASSISLMADELNAQGLVTFSNLENSGQSTIDGGNIKTASMSFDSARGGTIVLGGSEYGNGELRLFEEGADTEDAESASVVLSATDSKGIDNIRITNLEAPGLSKVLEQPMMLYVDSQYGNDDANGDDFSRALSTISEAVSRIPKVLHADVKIYWYRASLRQPVYENIMIQGFTGSGTIRLHGQNNNSDGSIVEGQITISGCNNPILLDGFRVKCVDGNHCGVLVKGSSNVQCHEIIVDGRNNVANLIQYDEGSHGFVEGCTGINATQFLVAEEASHVVMENCTTDKLYRVIRMVGGFISVGPGNNVKGGNLAYKTKGGEYFVESGVDFSLAGSSSEQDTSTTSSYNKTWSATDSRSWRDNYGWRDNSYVYQGEWNGWGHHKGFWYFGTSVSDAIAGSSVKDVKVYVDRRNDGGNFGEVPIYVKLHGHTSYDGSTSFLDSNSKTIGLSRGNDGWLTLPSSWYSAFEDGSAKGVGVYVSSTSNSYYAIMNGNAKIKVSYEK